MAMDSTVANQMTLVYFGSVFLHERVTAHPHISREVLTWDTTLILRSQKVKLKDVLEDMHAKIKDDLARLKLAQFLDSQSQGCFRRLEGQDLYVYEHNGYTECSNAKLSQFKICCVRDIEESLNLVYDLDHENQDEFLPFFHPNPVLSKLYDTMYEQCTSSARKERIKECKDRVAFVTTNKSYRNDEDKCFLLDSKDFCHSEDVWSERLGYILRNVYPNVNEVVATKKGNAANEVILTKLPKGMTLKMILFHGCPDLIINLYPLMINQGCIENKQQGEFAPYVTSSPIPDQCGQLLACVYQQMVIQFLRRLMNVECRGVWGQGMFIVQKSDVYLFSMYISNGGLQIKASTFTSCGTGVAMFCVVMDKFINSITEV